MGLDGVFEFLEEHAVHLHALEPNLRFLLGGDGVSSGVVVVAVFGERAANCANVSTRPQAVVISA